MNATPPHCVLTGSSSGIGLALRHRLLAAGWRVTGLDRQDTSAEPNYRHLRVDLTDVAALSAASATLGSDAVTALVHCAGAIRTGGVADTDPRDADYLWRLHVAAPMQLTRELISRIEPQRGRIVFVSSRAALGRAQRVPYAASKAAQIGLARSFAAELVGRGITVNLVAPAAVDTPMLTDPARRAPPVVDLPIGRLIRPDEVAAAVEFLISSNAGAITGQTLYICGGSSLGVVPA